MYIYMWKFIKMDRKIVSIGGRHQSRQRKVDMGYESMREYGTIGFLCCKFYFSSAVTLRKKNVFLSI